MSALIGHERLVTDMAYLAGVVDSDGYIGIIRCRVAPPIGYKIAPRVAVRQVEREAIDLFAFYFGGSIRISHPPSHENKRPTFLWEMNNQKAAVVLRPLLPYLRIKLERAHIAIACAEFQASTRGVGRSQQRTTKHRNILLTHYWRCRKLNRLGRRLGEVTP